MSKEHEEVKEKSIAYEHRGRYNEPSPKGEDAYRLNEIAKKHMAGVKKK